MAKFENPVFATVALLTAGAVFAGIIVMSYPSGSGQDEEIPIVSADLRPVKMQPEERGGMDVPYRESSVLAELGQDRDEWAQTRDPGIENLLAATEEEMASKEEALARATEENIPSAEDMPEIAAMDEQSESADPGILLQKIEKPAPAADVTAEERPKELHAAATSPETIDFVKSVLDKDEVAVTEKAEEAEDAVKIVGAPKVVTPEPEKAVQGADEDIPVVVSRIEPAAGAAAPAVDLVKGSYYVQLASITARERADGEWAKLQRSFSAQLASSDYRVQAANLGERGVFYRIQAGPFSKDQANQICEAIKSQKPGGCLVVK